MAKERKEDRSRYLEKNVGGARSEKNWKSERLKKWIFSHHVKNGLEFNDEERENIFLIRQADVDNNVFLAIKSNWNQWLEKGITLEELHQV